MLMAAIACVLGNPYSRRYFTSSFTTGGVSGRGILSISFVACPIYL
jgi:hypothetical protein